MAHAKRRRCQRSLARTSAGVAADPVTAGLSAPLVGVLSRDDIPLHHCEGIAGRGPIVQRAALEVQIDRASVRLSRHAVGRHARLVGNVETPFHTRQSMARHRTVVDVALRGRERDVGPGGLVENLWALDVEPLERDVVHHQLAVDDGDADRLTRARPERRVADAIDITSDAAVPEHRRLEDVLAIDGRGFGGRRLGKDVPARAGKEENKDAEGHRKPRRKGHRMLHGACSPAVGYQIGAFL